MLKFTVQSPTLCDSCYVSQQTFMPGRIVFDLVFSKSYWGGGDEQCCQTFFDIAVGLFSRVVYLVKN